MADVPRLHADKICTEPVDVPNPLLLQYLKLTDDPRAQVEPHRAPGSNLIDQVTFTGTDGSKIRAVLGNQTLPTQLEDLNTHQVDDYDGNRPHPTKTSFGVLDAHGRATKLVEAGFDAAGFVAKERVDVIYRNEAEDTDLALGATFEFHNGGRLKSSTCE